MTKMKNQKIYVSMTDKFMSGWGKAQNKTDKFIIICNTMEQAETIERNAQKRSEMKYINICLSKPYYNQNRYEVSYRNFDELGSTWKQ
jgi:hypothetical protein